MLVSCPLSQAAAENVLTLQSQVLRKSMRYQVIAAFTLSKLSKSFTNSWRVSRLVLWRSYLCGLVYFTLVWSLPRWASKGAMIKLTSMKQIQLAYALHNGPPLLLLSRWKTISSRMRNSTIDSRYRVVCEVLELELCRTITERHETE